MANQACARRPPIPARALDIDVHLVEVLHESHGRRMRGVLRAWAGMAGAAAVLAVLLVLLQGRAP